MWSFAFTMCIFSKQQKKIMTSVWLRLVLKRKRRQFISVFWPHAPTPTKTKYLPISHFFGKIKRIRKRERSLTCSTMAVTKVGKNRTNWTNLSDWALHVSDDGAVRIIKKLYANLGHVTSVTSSAQNLVDLGELDSSRRILIAGRENK